MKNILMAVVSIITLTLTACSSSSDSKPPAPAPAPGGGVNNNGGPVQNGVLTAQFDKDAFGVWLTKDCYAMQNDPNSTARIVLTVNGNGKASQGLNVYMTHDCSGIGKAAQSQEFTYTIDNYANGGGQITVNGEFVDITISNGHLTTSTGTVTREYVKQ